MGEEKEREVLADAAVLHMSERKQRPHHLDLSSLERLKQKRSFVQYMQTS